MVYHSTVKIIRYFIGFLKKTFTINKKKNALLFNKLKTFFSSHLKVSSKSVYQFSFFQMGNILINLQCMCENLGCCALYTSRLNRGIGSTQ